MDLLIACNYLIVHSMLMKNAVQMKAFGRFPQQLSFTTSASRYAGITMKITQPSELDKLSYEEKNAKLQRELSPHLTIYKPQLTSMISITHRGTGTIGN